MKLSGARLIGCLCLFLSACSGPDGPTSSTANPAQAPASGRSNSVGHNVNDPAVEQTIVRTEESSSARISRQRAVPGELLVKFKPQTTKTGMSLSLNKVSVQGVRSYGALSKLRRVRVAPGVATDEAMEIYRNDPAVEYVEPNYIYSKAAIPNDPRFGEQWSLHNTGQNMGLTDADIDAPEAWDVSTGGASLVVAVIDTGVDYTHEDLAANIFTNSADCDSDGVDDDANGYADDCHGIDTANDDSDPADDEGHGTHVAGILGAVGNNGIGIAGVAWNVRILPCKFLNDQGTGTVADAIECLDYIAMMKDRGVNIIASNNSWSGYEGSRALSDAIVAQRDRGILFVAAAGNAADDIDFFAAYPCSVDSPNVICVANYTSWGLPDTSSNKGNFSVHVGAPGVAILSTLPGNTYGVSSGTSMAAPHVSGVIALLAAQNPARTWSQNRNLVLSSGTTNVNYDPIIATVTKRHTNAHGALTCSNRPLQSRVSPRFRHRELHRVGDQLTFAAIRIDCANPAGAMNVQIAPGNTTLALVDDGLGSDAVAGDGVYSASWAPSAAGQHTLTFTGALPGTTTVTVIADAHLKPGFPAPMVRAGGSYSPPIYTTVGDITGDGRAEIIATSLAVGPVHVWHYDGSPAAGWPRMEANGIAYETLGAGYPVLAQLDASTTVPELVVSYYGGTIAGYTAGATLLPGWPSTLRASFGLERRPVAADLDRDGLDEIFVYDNGTMNVLRPDGGTVAGWAPFDGTPPAIADLDGDQEPEIVWVDSVSNGVLRLYAKHRDGSMLAGFPFINEGFTDQPMIGDIDGDGRNEILFASALGVFKVSAAGAISQVVPTIHPTFLVSHSRAALGDLDGDGVPEIVMAVTHRPGAGYNQTAVLAWHGDGAVVSGFPVDFGELRHMDQSGPVIADVDSDGHADIVIATEYSGVIDGLLYAVNNAGVTLAGFPKQFSMGGGTIPAVVDLDANGHNDIVIAGSGWDGTAGGPFDGVWAFEVDGPVQNGPIEWNQFAGDSRHHSYYELGKSLPNHAFVSAHVRGNGSISATGLSCGVDCVERIAKGTNITLTANAGPGSSFARWLGACSGTSPTCVISSIQNYTSVVAEFTVTPPDATLSVMTSGAGSGRVTDSSGNISCPGTCSRDYPMNSIVTLTAAADAGSRFAGWLGACSGSSPTCQVTMNVARSVTASFAPDVSLTVTKQGSGVGSVTSSPAGIDCGADCSESFASGTVVTLTAQPSASSTFAGWGGACTGTAATCTVTMSTTRAVTATFVLPSVPLSTLSVGVSGSGTGRVTSTPSGIDCGADCAESVTTGASITLTASADAGSTFVGWSGACIGSAACTVVVNGATSVTANFVRNPRLTVSVSGSGSIGSNPPGISCNADCDETYAPGRIVTLTAQPAAGSEFDSWTGACSGQSSTCNVTMNSDLNTTAAFRTVPPANNPSTGGTGGGGGGGSMSLLMLLLGVVGGLRRYRQTECLRS